MKHVKPDVVLKSFWRDNERFASLFNTVLFHGQEVIHPEMLQEVDSEVSNMVEFGNYREMLVRSRDVVKKTAQGVDFIVLGMESQMNTHYAMPLRVMLYDALGYLKEYQALAHRNRTTGDMASAGEFLSALKKSDHLHPIISIVIYYGEEPWDGPLSLKDMIADMPGEVADVVSDYRMHLLQVRESGHYQFDNEDVQTVFEIARYVLGEQFEELEKQYETLRINAELAVVIGAITGSEPIMEQAAEGKGGLVNMYSALEKLEERGIERGQFEMLGKLVQKEILSLETAANQLNGKREEFLNWYQAQQNE